MALRCRNARQIRGNPSSTRRRSGRKGRGRAAEPLSPMTLQEFERAYEIFRGELAKGRDPKGKPLQVDGLAPKWIDPESLPEDLRPLYPEGAIEGTMDALLAGYLTHAQTKLAARTYCNYRGTAKTKLLPRYGKIPISLFTKEDVQGLLTEITRRAPQTVREVKKVISCAFRYGMAHVPGVKLNPCIGIEVTVAKGERKRWLPDEELMTFFETLPKMDDPKAADCYLLMLSSLCRPGEAASVRAEDLIVINGERVWRIPDTTIAPRLHGASALSTPHGSSPFSAWARSAWPLDSPPELMRLTRPM